MSKKKKRKIKLNVVQNINKDLFCGFPLVKKNINQMWNWQTLENC